MRLARGRAVVDFDRNFDIEDVSDHLKTSLGRQIWVAVDTLAEQSARRRRALREMASTRRATALEGGDPINSTADVTAGGSEPAELAAGRAGARRDTSVTAPLAHAGRHRSAAGSTGACRTRAPHIYGLEGLGHIIGMGPGSRLASCTASTQVRHSHIPIGSNS